MKKFTSILAAATFVVALSSCGNKSAETTETPVDSVAVTEEVAPVVDSMAVATDSTATTDSAAVAQ